MIVNIDGSAIKEYTNWDKLSCLSLYIFLSFWGNERRQKPNIPHLGELILKFLVQFFSHLSFNFNSLPVQKWPLCMYCTAAGELYSFFIWWLSMLFFPPLLCDQQVFRFFMLFLHCTVSKTIAHFIIMVQFLQCDMYVWQAWRMKYNKKT